MSVHLIRRRCCSRKFRFQCWCLSLPTLLLILESGEHCTSIIIAVQALTAAVLKPANKVFIKADLATSEANSVLSSLLYAAKYGMTHNTRKE